MRKEILYHHPINQEIFSIVGLNEEPEHKPVHFADGVEPYIHQGTADGKEMPLRLQEPTRSSWCASTCVDLALIWLKCCGGKQNNIFNIYGLIGKTGESAGDSFRADKCYPGSIGSNLPVGLSNILIGGANHWRWNQWRHYAMMNWGLDIATNRPDPSVVLKRGTSVVSENRYRKKQGTAQMEKRATPTQRKTTTNAIMDTAGKTGDAIALLDRALDKAGFIEKNKPSIEFSSYRYERTDKSTKMEEALETAAAVSWRKNAFTEIWNKLQAGNSVALMAFHPNDKGIPGHSLFGYGCNGAAWNEEGATICAYDCYPTWWKRAFTNDSEEGMHYTYSETVNCYLIAYVIVTKV